MVVRIPGAPNPASRSGTAEDREPALGFKLPVFSPSLGPLAVAHGGDRCPVHQQVRARDETGLGTDAKLDRCGDVVGCSDAPGCRRGDHAAHHLAGGDGQLLLAHGRGNDAGADGDDPGAPSAPFQGSRRDPHLVGSLAMPYAEPGSSREGSRRGSDESSPAGVVARRFFHFRREAGHGARHTGDANRDASRSGDPGELLEDLCGTDDVDLHEPSGIGLDRGESGRVDEDAEVVEDSAAATSARTEPGSETSVRTGWTSCPSPRSCCAARSSTA